jgi:hypothetical protein
MASKLNLVTFFTMEEHNTASYSVVRSSSSSTLLYTSVFPTKVIIFVVFHMLCFKCWPFFSLI